MATKKTTTKKAPKPTAKKAAKAKKAKPAAEKSAKRLSQFQAAIKVLAEAGEPMNCKAMFEAMTVKLDGRPVEILPVEHVCRTGKRFNAKIHTICSE